MKSIMDGIEFMLTHLHPTRMSCPVTKRTFLSMLVILTFFFTHGRAQGFNATYVTTEKSSGGFVISQSGRSSPIIVSSHDYPGVLRVAKQIVEDIGHVSGAEPKLFSDSLPPVPEVILIGTIGKNPWIDSLVAARKLDPTGVAGRRESFLIQIVDAPFPGIRSALVVVGSEKRGTIYGLYDLSKQIGVSPWYWWADVPITHRASLYVQPGRFLSGEPAVKYRGIFINDEAPALSGWSREKFGGFNSKFYEHVFELILRLRGNYLWPAMWGSAFYDDDPISPVLADEYGIVVGTSHHEPMARAHDEWRRYGKGAWNYEKNDSTLREFWKQGIKRMGSNESIVTVGMRGDGDMPMSEGANIALLERIVKDQREIIGQVTGKDVATIPQDWALYKEVQEYYDKGMRVPDDITLLLCDDNWGNIRKLPKVDEKPRAGGYGIYYHFDYVGGPRNYKWLNTNQISRVWEQMNLAYSYGARNIWIVNVGDIKPMEFPIQFFLDYAWDPGQWPAERLPEYTRLWAEQQFGKEHAAEIAEIITAYTNFNSRRKPELLSPETYSLTYYHEAERVVSEYNKLAERARRLFDTLPAEQKDAFYQLVLFPVEACANVNDLYVTVGTNRLYASQGRSATNVLAQRARELFAKDSAISYRYHQIAGGKWNHMMDQTHIGYTYWQQPDNNTMPEVKEIELSPGPQLGIAIEGSSSWWPNEKTHPFLPEFDSYSRRSSYIDIFNRGREPFDFSVRSNQPWLKISIGKGTIAQEERIWVSLDWKKVPNGINTGKITVYGGSKRSLSVYAVVRNLAISKGKGFNGFVESDKCVAIEAEHYTSMVERSGVGWKRIPDLGRTLSGMTPYPVTAPVQTPGEASPHLEYEMYLGSGGTVSVQAYLSPTLNFHNNQGLRYAVSFDNEPPQVDTINNDNSLKTWEKWVANNINITSTRHRIRQAGVHVLKFWMVDPGIVLQRLVVDAGGVKPSYLGPPESLRLNAEEKNIIR